MVGLIVDVQQVKSSQKTVTRHETRESAFAGG